mmetsp:Transcript_2694/g.5568  ORF Transcript_2694/g.5568 Transcript_2694/m.5568 type:complete len:108 (-) Transcript_2694:169-492(-)
MRAFVCLFLVARVYMCEEVLSVLQLAMSLMGFKLCVHELHGISVASADPLPLHAPFQIRRWMQYAGCRMAMREEQERSRQRARAREREREREIQRESLHSCLCFKSL